VAAAFQSPVLFTIADLSRMQLLTEINEGEIGGVEPGSRVSFHVESIGPVTFEGTVTAVRLQPYAKSTGAVATTGSTPGTATATNAAGSSAASGAASAGAPSTAGSTGTAGNAGSTTCRTIDGPNW
jgi:multidrug resistance efflux pump